MCLIQIGNADLTSHGLRRGFTSIDVTDWNEYGIVLKYCTPHIMRALDRVLPLDLGELVIESAYRLGFKPGRKPSEQFAAAVVDFKGDAFNTRVIIAWCLLLTLELEFSGEGLAPHALMAAKYLAEIAWKAAFRVPLPQHMQFKLVDVPKQIREREEELFESHRHDSPLTVTVPAQGAVGDVSPFVISTVTHGDILVSKGGASIGLRGGHSLRHHKEVTFSTPDHDSGDFVTQVQLGETVRRFRVHREKTYACLRILPSK